VRVERTGQQPSPARALIAWAVVAAAAALVAILSHQPARAQATPEQMERGALLYQQRCAQCHGGNGSGGVVQGTDRPAPAVDQVEVAYVDLVLRSGRMPPPGDPFDNRLREPTVTGEDREALVAWMTDAFGLEGEIPEVQAGDPAEGLPVYAVQCAHCHGSSGGGGVAGAGAFTPPLTSYEPVVIAEAIRVGPFEMPRFSEEQLTDEEVGAVAGYLAAVEQEQGTPIFGLVEINPVYASAFVALLALVVVLSLFWIGGTPSWFPDPRPEPEEKDE
jgi:ubiquinol-cytochrome c reductase cytochrome c subunit